LREGKNANERACHAALKSDEAERTETGSATEKKIKKGPK